MQLDDQLIDVKEGSMISIKPQVSRCLKAADDSELVYICIQARENSLNQATKQDGQREKTEPLFK